MDQATELAQRLGAFAEGAAHQGFLLVEPSGPPCVSVIFRSEDLRRLILRWDLRDRLALPPQDDAAIARRVCLWQLLFEPDDGPDHFFRRVGWPRTAEDLRAIADGTVHVLRRVYEVSEARQLHFVLQRG